MASPTHWTWVWVNSGSWWWKGRPEVLQSMGSQRVGHDWASELSWTKLIYPLSVIKIEKIFPSHLLFPNDNILFLLLLFFSRKHAFLYLFFPFNCTVVKALNMTSTCLNSMLSSKSMELPSLHIELPAWLERSHFPIPKGTKSPFYSLILWIWLFYILHIARIVQCLFFYDWVILLNIMHSRLIHVVTYSRILLFCKADIYIDR